MEQIYNTIEEYRIQCLRVGRGHYEAGETLARKELLLGGSVIGLSTLVATALFATLSSGSNILIRLVAALVAAATAVISALETFLGLSRRSEAHKAAGSHYGSVRRELEILNLDLRESVIAAEQALERLKEIITRLSTLADNSPHLPGKFYKQQAVEYPAGKS